MSAWSPQHSRDMQPLLTAEGLQVAVPLAQVRGEQLLDEPLRFMTTMTGETKLPQQSGARPSIKRRWKTPADTCGFVCVGSHKHSPSGALYNGGMYGNARAGAHPRKGGRNNGCAQPRAQGMPGNKLAGLARSAAERITHGQGGWATALGACATREDRARAHNGLQAGGNSNPRGPTSAQARRGKSGQRRCSVGPAPLSAQAAASKARTPPHSDRQMLNACMALLGRKHPCDADSLDPAKHLHGQDSQERRTRSQNVHPHEGQHAHTQLTFKSTTLPFLSKCLGNDILPDKIFW